MSSIWNAFRGPRRPRALPTPAALRKRGSALLAALTLLTACSSGCSVVHNGYVAMTQNGSWNDTVVVLRNRSFSAKAWHRRKHHFCKQKHLSDFCNGFRAGYEACASGSDGCTPAFPPSEYWSWEYQSAEGQARTAAWYAGYPHGAQAAEQDGVSNWSQVPMSAGMQAEFQQAGILTHDGALYPIPDPPANGFSNGDPVIEGLTLPVETIPNAGAEQIMPNGGVLPLQGPAPRQIPKPIAP